MIVVITCRERARHAPERDGREFGDDDQGRRAAADRARARGRGSRVARALRRSGRRRSRRRVMSGFGAAMIGVLWAYEGWQYVTFSAGETRDPQRVFPRAIGVATFALIVLYLLANVGYVAAIGPAAAAQSGPRRRRRHRARSFGSLSGKLLERARARVDLQRDERSGADGAASLLRDGARRSVLRALGDRQPAIRHAGVGDRVAVVLVRAPRAHRHVRAAAHLRRVRRLDFLRPRRARACSRRDATLAERRAAVPDARLSRHTRFSSPSPRRCSSANTLYEQTRQAAIGLAVVLARNSGLLPLACAVAPSRWNRRSRRECRRKCSSS